MWQNYNDTDNSGKDDDIFFIWSWYPKSPLTLTNPRVTPVIGNSDTDFNFTINYFHLENNLQVTIQSIFQSEKHLL